MISKNYFLTISRENKLVFVTQQQIRHIIPADIPLPVDPVSNHLVLQSITPKTPRKSQQHGHKKDKHSSDPSTSAKDYGNTCRRRF